MRYSSLRSAVTVIVPNPKKSLSGRDGAVAPPRRSVLRLHREAPADATDPVVALSAGFAPTQGGGFASDSRKPDACGKAYSMIRFLLHSPFGRENFVVFNLQFFVSANVASTQRLVPFASSETL